MTPLGLRLGMRPGRLVIMTAAWPGPANGPPWLRDHFPGGITGSARDGLSITSHGVFDSEFVNLTLR